MEHSPGMSGFSCAGLWMLQGGEHHTSKGCRRGAWASVWGVHQCEVVMRHGRFPSRAAGEGSGQIGAGSAAEAGVGWDGGLSGLDSQAPPSTKECARYLNPSSLFQFLLLLQSPP